MIDGWITGKYWRPAAHSKDIVSRPTEKQLIAINLMKITVTPNNQEKSLET